MKRLFVVSLAVIGLNIFASAVSAQTISSVGSPNVSKDVTVIETRLGYSTDKDGGAQNQRLRGRFHVDHGFTNNYAARLIIAGDKRRNTNYEHDSITFENRFDLFDADEIGFDFGMRGSYTLKDGDKKPDNITIGFYELLPLKKWEIRANQFISHEIGEGSDSGVSLANRIQATYPLINNHRIGVETFNNFGIVKNLSGYSNQDHVLGTVLKGKFMESFAYETGYFTGISNNSPDHNYKLFLSKRF